MTDEVHHLTEGTIEVLGRISSSSNQALLVKVVDGAHELLACYKAEAGERPLWDFDEGLWRREVAAYALDQLLGTDVVPTTVARLDGPFGPGSLQRWISEDDGEHYFTLRERTELADWFFRLALFDTVANNADRKSGHVIFDGERCWAIDNGLSFHVEPKLRTVVWEYAGVAIPPPWLERLDAVREKLDVLREWLSDEEVTALDERVAALRTRATLPEPDLDGDVPPYPWPLI